MSELRIETLVMPAADLGPENPLPGLAGAADVHARIEIAPDIPEEDRRHVGYGRVSGCLPYRLQDGYGRDRRPRAFRVAVLENEWLRALFLLELGGRLWSLVHKPTGRELLDVNPVFQPGNLAIRNAWFCGGVEWNVGIIGHSAFTCAPLFAARADGPHGAPVLRLYEWERIRQVPFQIDCYLPDGSPVLFVRVRLTNPHPHETPIFWWSTIAVPETPRTRVVVPADDAYSFSYGGRMQRVSIPRLEDVDVTYPTRLKRAMDYFYRIPEGRRPWITALDEGGRGLIQTSTARQKGRKLFLWGTGPGGRRWQEWLAVPGHAYIEIQAGLTRTQSENLPMPPGADWSWTEAYGLMQADPAAVHGADWARAREDVDTRLEALIPRQTLEAEYRRGADVADRPPADILQCGSGWGALERLRREAAGDPPFCGPSLVFGDETLGEDQAPWLALLRHGEMPRPAPGANPCSCVVQSEWRALLERAVSAGRGAHWMAWLQLGVMRYAAGEPAAARQAWEESLALNRTAWALRNLAILAQAEQRRDEGADLFVNALRLRPDLVPLAAECGRALVEAGRSEQWLDLLAGLPPAVRNRGRLRLLEGRAALATGDLARVEETLAGRPTIEDLRESEVSLTDLWFGLHAQRLSAAEHRPLDDALRARVRGEFPPPPEIDFRMNVGA